LICEILDEDGLSPFPLADFDRITDARNRRLVEDYVYWLENAPFESETEPVESVILGPGGQQYRDEGAAGSDGSVLRSLVTWLLWCLICGGVGGTFMGAAVRTVDGAFPGAMVGGVLMAVLVGILAYGVGWKPRSAFLRPWACSLFGAIVGGGVGMIAGAALLVIIAAPLGALAGAGVGALLLRWWVRRPWRGPATVLGLIAGTLLGATGLSVYRNPPTGMEGEVNGLLLGLGIGLVFAVVLPLLHVIAAEGE
jgi:hypothetical protein